MPVAAAKPSFSELTNLDQAQAPPLLQEILKSASRFDYSSENSLPCVNSEIPLVLQMSQFSEQKRTDISSFLVQPVKNILRLSEIEHPYRSVQWLSQDLPPSSGRETQVIKVMGVRLNPIPNGLEVILETTSHQQIQVAPSSLDKTFVVNIKNAQLALERGNTFRANNPTSGITAITVTQQGINNIQITVTGTAGVPTGQVTQRAGSLVLSLSTASDNTTEPIEVVSTSEPQKPESEYRVPNATTATKINTPVRDIPQSIQVIPRAVIEDRQVVNLEELSDNVSGVQPDPGYGGLSSAGFRIRGFTLQYENLRDGFRDFGYLSPRDVANVEQVEFLKGPASVLYGGGAGSLSGLSLSGVVNTVTKNPLDQPYHNLDFTAGSYDFYRTSVDFNEPLNPDKSLLFRLNEAYENASSFRDFDGHNSYIIAPTLTWKIDPRTSVTFKYEHQDYSYFFDVGFPPEPEFLRIPISRVVLAEPGFSHADAVSNSATYEFKHQFNDDWKFRQGFNTQLSSAETQGFGQISFADLNPDRRTLPRFAYKTNEASENFTLQNEISGKFETGPFSHNILVGLELARYQFRYDYFRTPASSIDILNPQYGTLPVFTSPPTGNESGGDNLGIYLQDLVQILPNVKILAGGRFDYNDLINKSLQPNQLINEQTESHFSPRIGIVYQPGEDTSLYFNWSNSFTPQFAARSRTNSPFKPTIGEQFEFGIKQEFLSKKLSATLAFYQITEQNVLTPDPIDTTFSVQTGEQKSRGIELDVAGQLLPGWKVIATYAYTDALVSQDNSIPVGQRLAGVPRNSASLWTTYEIQHGDIRGLGVGLGIVFAGDSQATLPNTIKLPSYVRADAALFYRRNNYRVDLNIKNLFDTKYYEDVEAYAIRPGAPLTILGKVSVQF
jgi:iron complex outermembrane receptor protein